MTAAVCHPLLSPARALRAMVASACCFWLAGCAGPAGLFGSDARAAPFRDPGMSMQSAKDLVVIGEATRADVMAALGPATVVKFDSGFEVWVYRAKLPESKVGRPNLSSCSRRPALSKKRACAQSMCGRMDEAPP